jgi:hypothetical protein
MKAEGLSLRKKKQLRGRWGAVGFVAGTGPGRLAGQQGHGPLCNEKAMLLECSGGDKWPTPRKFRECCASSKPFPHLCAVSGRCCPSLAIVNEKGKELFSGCRKANGKVTC